MEIRLPDARYTCPISPFGENSLLTFLTVVSFIGVSPHRRAPPVLTKHELGVTRPRNEAAQRADPVEPESTAAPLSFREPQGSSLTPGPSTAVRTAWESLSPWRLGLSDEPPPSVRRSALAALASASRLSAAALASLEVLTSSSAGALAPSCSLRAATLFAPVVVQAGGSLAGKLSSTASSIASCWAFFGSVSAAFGRFCAIFLSGMIVSFLV